MDDKSSSLWHHHLPEVDFKNRNLLISEEVKVWSFDRVLFWCEENFHGKLCRNPGPRFIFFNHLFGCPKGNSEPLDWQGDNVAYSILIAAFYRISGKSAKDIAKDQNGTNLNFQNVEVSCQKKNSWISIPYIVLASFPSSIYVDEVVNNWANYQRH